MSYYSLLAREMHNGKLSNWGVQFGDYDRSVVKAEMEDLFDSDECNFVAMRIIKTKTARQSEIAKAIAELTAEGLLP